MISRDAQAFVKQREQRLAKGIEIVTEELSLKVGTDDVISSINASSEGISIDAQKININGVISANGGFIVDTEGNMTANNGTFNGVVNATDGVFNGTVHATDGEFTGEINATSGTIDSITATNLTVNSGTFAGSLQAASGTIDNVTATNLTLVNGTMAAELQSNGLQITNSSGTVSARYGNGLLQFAPGDALTNPHVMLGMIQGKGFLQLGITDTIYLSESSNTITAKHGTGYVEIFGGDDTDEPYIKVMSGFTSGSNVVITPTTNVAGLSYTVVSTF